MLFIDILFIRKLRYLYEVLLDSFDNLHIINMEIIPSTCRIHSQFLLEVFSRQDNTYQIAKYSLWTKLNISLIYANNPHIYYVVVRHKIYLKMCKQCVIYKYLHLLR